MNVLVVDDDSIDRAHIKRSLQAHHRGCSTMEAPTVDEGLHLVRQNQFDVVLLDYKMPKRDGIEMVLELRNEFKDTYMAIVMMSTSEDEDLAMDCLRAGAHDFLLKMDITPARLHRSILFAQTRFELERKLFQSYQKVKQLAERDPLTGLANRYLFDESLKMAVANNRRHNSKVALLLIDLDNFKYVNDNHGHDVGDLLLMALTERIRKYLRDNELFARLGGDEFAITLANLEHPSHANRVARRILTALKQPFIIGNHSIVTGASIGIAICPDNCDRAEELFKFADIAMYRAKKQGRNQVCFFEGEMQIQFSQRYQTEIQLRQSLEEGLFELYYQPVVNPHDGHFSGFEALIRWNYEGAVRSPAEFIPVAEESGLILEMGRWVIEHALAQLARWNDRHGHPLRMAINLSAMQLKDVGLTSFIQRHLEVHNIDPYLVDFELTETALLDECSQNVQTIQNLADMGCHIALDDFGTGYSSISYLRKFPIDVVKVDKSLMPGKDQSHKELSLLRGLISMIQSLELDIVIEGIETEEHECLCKEFNVDRAQGFYYYRPLPARDIESRLFR